MAFMDRLTLFGLFAVSAMLICYALENRSHWFVLAFAGACALGSAYGFLQGAWPFGIVEAVWSLVALRRWRMSHRTINTADELHPRDRRGSDARTVRSMIETTPETNQGATGD
jgi:hypothetical protein